MSAEPEIEGELYLSLAARFALDPDEHIIPHTGRLILEAEDGNYLVGKLRYYVVRVNAMLGSGVDPSMALDGLSADTADYCELFNENRDGWSEAVERVWPEPQFGDMVIFDRLIINPPFRGKEVGLKCLWLLTQIIGGISLFVMRPMPLQYIPAFAKYPEVAKMVGDKAADLRKLTAYYKKVGFRAMRGTGQMVLDPTMINPFDQRKDLQGDIRVRRTPALDTYRLPTTEDAEEIMP